MSGPVAENSGPSTSSGAIQNAVTTGINRLKNKFKTGRQGQGKFKLGLIDFWQNSKKYCILRFLKNLTFKLQSQFPMSKII